MALNGFFVIPTIEIFSFFVIKFGFFREVILIRLISACVSINNLIFGKDSLVCTTI
jgi:hypothetical protein